MNKSTDIEDAVNRYLQVKVSAEETQWKDKWQSTQWFYTVSAFSHYICRTSSREFEDPYLLLYEKYVPCTLWSEIRMSRINLLDVWSLTSHECGAEDVPINVSEIAHS